jgi:signal transduction histidine kinase
VIVRTQAARLRRERGLPADDDVLADVEATAGEALTAMRSLVDMLRAGAAQLAAVPADLASSVAEAIGDDARIRLEMGPQVAALAVPPEVPATVHRLVLESLTNVRRHAAATQVRVQLRTDGGELLLDVVNDGVPAARAHRSGNGIVGMAERARALGGSLHAGPEDGRCWRVAARLPLRRDGAA